MSAPGLQRTLRLVALVVCPAALLIATGVAGVGRPHGYWASGWDMHFLYAAGHTWLSGRNPYDLETLTAFAAGIDKVYPAHLAKSGFAYMPQSFPLCAALAALPLAGATVLMTLLNLASVGVVIWGCLRLATRAAPDHAQGHASSSRPWVFVAPAVLASPFTAQVLWLGQTSLLTTALVIAAWITARQGNDARGGVLLALASSKIQLALLPAVWLALERRARLTLAALAAAVAMLAVPLVASGGPLALTTDWLSALEAYRMSPYSSPAFPHSFSLHALLAAVGMELPAPALVPAAALAVLLVWRQRRALGDLGVLGALLAVAVLLGPAHDYDLVSLAPLLTALWQAGGPRARAVLLASLVLLFLPHRLLSGLELPEALRWREAVVVGQLAWLLLASRRGGSRASSS